ncbi:MAG: tyrosine-type recombinase/integrase [Acidimicrobiales bacterium]
MMADPDEQPATEAPSAMVRATEKSAPTHQPLAMRYPARTVGKRWTATARSREQVTARLRASPAASKSATKRDLGIELLLDWLSEQRGETWQERWLASGVEAARAQWRQVTAGWLMSRGHARWRRDVMSVALRSAIGADVIRPSLGWLVSSAMAPGSLVANLASVRDPAGFARVRAHGEQRLGVSALEVTRALYRCALIVAAKGGGIDEIRVGDVNELFDAETDQQGKLPDGSFLLYQVLYELGTFGTAAPTSLRVLRVGGQRSPEELIDRYHIICRPIRDLLVTYLRERQPALDYTSLESLANFLGKLFWADIEGHHPGIDTLALPVAVVNAWKARLKTVTKTVITPTGEKVETRVERINYQECLRPVRAFYLDLAQWALEEPGRWSRWVAPCPIRSDELSQKKAARRRKARIDARTRERLPRLPDLVRAAEKRRAGTVALLETARRAEPGETFSTGDLVLRRSVLESNDGRGSTRAWAEDPATGRRRDLTREEDHAFWSFAVVKVLQATGLRVEELLELSHHSLVQYRLPTSGELVPLLQVAPSKTDAERLLVVSPELADVLSAIITRVRGAFGAVPLVPAYDHHERRWLQPAPVLFQRRIGTENRAFTPVFVRRLLSDTLSRAGIVEQTTGLPLRFTPHDFRRMFITDAVMNGLPPHIAQIIAGHQDINVTMGYKAVYPEETIQAHLAFLARRRALRPSEEYRTPTDEEWTEFLGHFERRKVSIGTCARAFSTPCIHEHACVRCSMLWPDPAQRTRLVEIRDNLTARIAEAEREGWLGEVDGLQLSLAGATDKLAQIDQHTGTQAVELRRADPSPKVSVS